MTAEELNSETCGAKGNVVSWDTLIEKGTSNRTERAFSGCKYTNI